MYCLTVSYPKAEGTSFDFEYYQQTHIPLCARLFGEHGYVGYTLRTEEGKGPGSGDLGYASIDLIFESREHLQAALAAGAAEVGADVANYTDTQPRMSFSEMSLNVG